MPKINNLLQITEMTPLGNILLSYGNKVINPGFNLLTHGLSSKKTFKVAFPVSDKSTPLFKVVFKGIIKNYKGATLRAITPDGSVQFSGTVKNSTVLMSAAFQPIVHQRSHFPSLTWQLFLTGRPSLELDKNALEIYWTPEPSTATTLNAKGTPVELLDQMSAMALTAAASPRDLVDQVFNFTPPRYDTLHGHSFFISGGFDNITLFYQAYLAAANEPGAVMNCYDAASILQYLMQQNNIAAKFIFLQPFGYLRLTNLIGRGQCDNPFYQYEGNAPVVDPTDPDRTSFGNHAFVQITNSQLIADACAGPHEGIDTPYQYVAAA